jgi:HAMP domain-containing protein
MQPSTKPIQTLLLQIFLPAVLLTATLLAVFAYNWHYATILDGFDRKLVATSALTGAMIDPSDHDALIDAAFAGADPETVEAGPQYRRNAGPLRRIRERLGLTYLYTQAIGGEQDIVYVLDGTTGDEHSPLGSPDDLTDQTLSGLREAESGRSVFVSPIEYQEQWGLLKTAAAPVYDRTGQVSATAGADVNISVILVATQNALFASTLIGVGSIIACLLIGLAIMRRVARPIEALKDQALGIAAGQTYAPPNSSMSREVAQLSQELIAFAAANAAVAAQRSATAQHQARQANIALLAQLHAPDPAVTVALLERGGVRVFWLPRDGDGIDPVLAALAARQLAERFKAQSALAEHWTALTNLDEGFCLLLDPHAGTIELRGTGAATIVTGTGEIALREGSPHRFDPARDAIRCADGREVRLG